MPLVAVAVLAACGVVATAAPPDIRVNLTPQPVKELAVSVDGRFRVRPVGSSRVLATSARLPANRVVARPGGFSIGPLTVSATRVEIIPDRSPAIRVAGNLYRGRLRLFRRPGGRLVAVNVLPLPRYLAAVVDAEMPATFPAAARRAQAVAARTYALSRIETGRDNPLFDLYGSTRSQRYLGVEYRDSRGRRLAGETAAGRRAVAETRGMVCLSAGRVFSTYYTAVCGGRTARGRSLFPDAAPPLASVTCTGCGDAPRFRWTVRIDVDTASTLLADSMKLRSGSFGRPDSIRTLSKGDGGRLPRFEFVRGNRRTTFSGLDLRRTFSPKLPSPFFKLELDGDELVFTGRGHGHGTGMCQWGAAGMARRGASFREILLHYYPGARLARLDALVDAPAVP